MTKSTSVKAFLAGITCVALACATTPALAQHMGGFHGSPGGGFHSGGYHGGGFQGNGGYRGGAFQGYGGYRGGRPAGPGGMYHGGPYGRVGGNSLPARNFSGARGSPSVGRGGNGAVPSRGLSGSTATAHAAIVDGQWHSFGNVHPAGSTLNSNRVGVATASFSTTWHGVGWWGHPASFGWGCCGWGWGWGFGFGFGFGFGWGSLWSPYWYWPPYSYSYYPWGYYYPPPYYTYPYSYY